MRNILNAVIRPRFGHLSITALSDADVQRMQSSFKGTPYYGNRCLGILSAMMNKAIERGGRRRIPAMASSDLMSASGKNGSRIPNCNGWRQRSTSTKIRQSPQRYA